MERMMPKTHGETDIEPTDVSRSKTPDSQIPPHDIFATHPHIPNVDESTSGMKRVIYDVDPTKQMGLITLFRHRHREKKNANSQKPTL